MDIGPRSRRQCAWLRGAKSPSLGDVLRYEGQKSRPVDEIAEYVLAAAIQMALPYWLLRRDEGKLSAAQAARRFPDSTFWVAIVAFGPLAIPIHFVRTRRSLVGLALGLAWLAVTLGASMSLGFVIEKIVGIILQSRL